MYLWIRHVMGMNILCLYVSICMYLRRNEHSTTEPVGPKIRSASSESDHPSTCSLLRVCMRVCACMCENERVCGWLLS